MSEEREKLKELIEKVNQQATKVARLQAAVARAEQTKEQAVAELQGFENLDKEITNWRVGQVKKNLPTHRLPEALKAKVSAKRAAEEEIEQSGSTLEALKGELSERLTETKAMEAERDELAKEILLSEVGEELAREYKEIVLRKDELYLLMQGLGYLNSKHLNPNYGPGHGATTPRFSALIADALRFEGYAYPPNSNPAADMSLRWQKPLHELLKDAHAVVSRPRLIAPSDYVRTDAGQAFGIPLPAEYTVRLEEL
jgi:hypothetical protein